MTDPTFLIALGGALLAAASIVLHVVAPRTKTTVDDALRDDIDEVLAFIRGQQPSRPQRTTPPPTPPTIAGKTTAIVLVVALGLGAGPMVLSCSAIRASPDAAKTAMIDCLKADVPAIAGVLAELGAAATLAALGNGAIDWQQIETASWAQGKVVGGCALAEFVAQLGKSAAPATPTVATLLPPLDPAADGRAALERFRARAGGVSWSTSVGVQ